MVDFSNLKKLDVTSESLAEYVWDDIPGEPSIWIAPATDQNVLFANERLRISIERAEAAEKAPRRGSGKKQFVTLEDIEEARETDRLLISRCCAKKWGKAPVDATGAAPGFSEENCYDFFKALPNWLFDPLRGFASNVYNFVDRDAEPVDPAAVDKAGNV